jgi:hypothetical protein
MKTRTCLVLSVVLLLGCDKKIDETAPDESLLRLNQLAERLDAKTVSEDIKGFLYTADFQDYFSTPDQRFVLSLTVEDILKVGDRTIAKCNSWDFNAMLFLTVDPDVLNMIKAQEQWTDFLAVVTIARVEKPFFGLTGNVEDFEIEYAKSPSEPPQEISKANLGFAGFYEDRDYEEPPLAISGSFYIEVADAPLILHGKCLHVEPSEQKGM